MIKNYLQFINESNEVPPGPGVEDCISISITDEDGKLFSQEPILSNLISNQDVSLIGNQVYYYDNDDVVNALNQFFPEKISNNLDEEDKEYKEEGHVSNESKRFK